MKQKVFRIEQMFADGAAPARAPEPQQVGDELKALRALAERRDSAAAEAVELLRR